MKKLTLSAVVGASAEVPRALRLLSAMAGLLSRRGYAVDVVVYYTGSRADAVQLNGVSIRLDESFEEKAVEVLAEYMVDEYVVSNWWRDAKGAS